MKRNDIGDSYVLGCSSGSLRGGKRWALAHSFIIVQLESWLAAAKRVHRSRIGGIRPSRSIDWSATVGRRPLDRQQGRTRISAVGACGGVRREDARRCDYA